MMRQSLFIYGALITCLFLPVSPAAATPVTYTFDVRVDTSGPGLGFGPVFDFSPDPLPQTFTGTFTADDAITGPITNFQLTVGTVDIAAAYQIVKNNEFNPTTGFLDYARDTSLATPISVFQILQFTGFPISRNFIRAADSDGRLGGDDWEGQLTSITRSPAAVPEPATLLLLSTGLLGLAGYRWSQRRHEGPQVR